MRVNLTRKSGLCNAYEFVPAFLEYHSKLEKKSLFFLHLPRLRGNFQSFPRPFLHLKLQTLALVLLILPLFKVFHPTNFYTTPIWVISTT